MVTEGMRCGWYFQVEGAACAEPGNKRVILSMFEKWFVVFIEQADEGQRLTGASCELRYLQSKGGWGLP